MKLEVGMYVRTKYGIGKLIEEGHLYNKSDKGVITPLLYTVDFKASPYKDRFDCYVKIEDILKSSHNIIDLIEVADYVNGREVIDIKMKCDETIKCLITKGYDITNEMIKSIVTKEQFKANEYVVKE